MIIVDGIANAKIRTHISRASVQSALRCTKLARELSEAARKGKILKIDFYLNCIFRIFGLWIRKV